ncbi:MAG: divergent polysaccharide deacetylase family protein [Candidatus Omnitrophota bacterium]|nr:divergent polysaccharide deacetylase family protein [Candidatus Omnitrophota bacterium]
MKTKIILISTIAVLIVASTFLIWRAAHAPKRKIIVIKKAALAKAVPKGRNLPAIKKRYSNPNVAIVIDDFGYNMNNLDKLFAIKRAVTFSVLPNLTYSKRVALLAASKGYEVILHLPLESNDKTAPAEAGTIKTDMSDGDMLTLLGKDIGSVPGLKGVSNHQGSKATQDKRTMTVILSDLKKRGLYFFDSLVTEKSVCHEAADRARVPYARRDMFLDNESSPEYIEKQMLSLRKIAFRNGGAIAVCHDRKNTITVLNKMMPELSSEGINFVSLSEMVE